MKKNLLRILFVLIPHSFAVFAIGQAGTLDSSFGTNGKVTSNLGLVGYYTWWAEPVAIQQDGKIVVCATVVESQNHSHFLVVRYKTNGSIDSTFGVNGKIDTYFDSTSNPDLFIDSVATTVLIQPDRKIVVGGFVYHPVSGPDFYAVARYLENGKPDSSFGTYGKTQSFIGPFPKENELLTMTLQTDGKLVVGGYSDGYCVVRYKTNGVIDSAFGIDGVVRTPDPYFSFGVTSVAMQQDGKIVAGARTNGFSSNTNDDFMVSRLLPNGNFDSSFGSNGYVLTNFFGGDEDLHSCIVLNDGSIVAAGSAYKPNESGSYAALAKYKSNGRLDSSFGTNGILTTKFGESSVIANKVMVQQDGKLLVSASSSSGKFITSRFTPTGKPDSTYGLNGKGFADFSPLGTSFSAALQQDGKVVLVGSPNVSLVRFKGDEPVYVSLKKSISVVEGNTGTTTPAQFLVILNKKSIVDVLVDYTTKNVNAIAGSDYTTTSGTLRIKAGKLSGNIVVPVVGDNVREVNEKFALVLSNPVNALAGVADSVVCTIRNDDAASLNINATAVENINVTSDKIKIFPNPAHDVLNLQGLSANEKAELTILDLTGKAVMKKTVSIPSLSWNISSLANGKYILQIATGTFIQNMPFIKQ